MLPLSTESRITLVALGKAAPAMAEAAAQILGGRLSAGVAAVPIGTTSHPPDRVTYVRAGHPIPDAGSLEAVQAAVSLLRAARPEDLVLALVSGGGSAMFEMPLPGLSLEDLQVLNRALLNSGADIAAVNTIRTALSKVKGGGLARLAAPARTAALIVSDVIGDRLSLIASGPTVLRPANPEAARLRLRRAKLWEAAPPAVRQCLHRPPAPRAHAPRPVNILVASSAQVLSAAASQARELGFQPRIVTRRLAGEAATVGADLALRLRRATHPGCWLFAGETTVHVDRPGLGGRNQELALSCALALQGSAGIGLMALATDGLDGPTDAAGAIVTSDTSTRFKVAGVDPQAALREHNSYQALDKVGALVRTGPTGTNVGDVVIALVYPRDAR